MPFFQAAACLLFGLSLALLAQRWEGASQSRDLGVHTVVFPLPGAPDRGLEATWSPLSSQLHAWSRGSVSTSGPGFPVMEGPPLHSVRLGFHCRLMGPHRCSGEVIRCLQPRPARTQEGKKGVTSSYSELVVAPQKSQSGARPLAVRPP